jgi:iron complex transport system ATP-binding protein
MSTPYLDIKNARVYQGETQVFGNFSAAFYRGQNTCVLGPNGAGKTTLLKLLTRDLYPVVRDGSYVKIDGSETAVLWEVRKKIGFVSHDLQIRYDAHVLGRDVVMSGLFGAIGMHGHFDVEEHHHQRVDELLNQFDLTHLQERRYWHLSTGQQRRFLLARALVHKPEILVLDEPTNGLDVKAAHALLNNVRELARSGTTLLLVTHHVQEILPEIERILLLKSGSVFADGEKQQVLNSGRLSALYETPLTLVEQNGFYQIFPG